METKQATHTPGAILRESDWASIEMIARSHGFKRRLDAHRRHYENLERLIEHAARRIEIANGEGNPILSAWLIEARAAIRNTAGE